MSDITDAVQAVAGGIQALAGLATVGIAIYAAVLARGAAFDWRSTLKHERADAALTAVLELQGYAGQLKAAYDRNDITGFTSSYDECHRARVAYRAALLTATRYYDDLDEEAPGQLLTALSTAGRNGDTALKAMKARAGGVVEPTGMLEKAADDSFALLMPLLERVVAKLRKTLGRA